MRILVIALSMVLMIGGGTVSVMKTLKLGPFAENTDMAMETASAKEMPSGPPMFVDMTPLTVPIFAGDKVAATLRIEVKLETVGASNQKKITRLLPRINDAFLQDLYTTLPQHIRKAGEVKVKFVKQRLERLAPKVTGKGVIGKVHVQSVRKL